MSDLMNYFCAAEKQRFTSTSSSSSSNIPSNNSADNSANNSAINSANNSIGRKRPCPNSSMDNRNITADDDEQVEDLAVGNGFGIDAEEENEDQGIEVINERQPRSSYEKTQMLPEILPPVSIRSVVASVGNYTISAQREFAAPGASAKSKKRSIPTNYNQTTLFEDRDHGSLKEINLRDGDNECFRKTVGIYSEDKPNGKRQGDTYYYISCNICLCVVNANAAKAESHLESAKHNENVAKQSKRWDGDALMKVALQKWVREQNIVSGSLPMSIIYHRVKVAREFMKAGKQ